eukprot:gb/GFBE01076708.1/.p1 GENE.gb/GFBE01076708.1/~~gb/GFBE01076708.1/.p1  ORF type:complete len:186 (+),score=29.57 gb/GFBE01076708.1/:1-558(+)
MSQLHFDLDDYFTWKSKPRLLDYWRMELPYRKDLPGSEYLPTVNSLPWPYGTKGTYISHEAALRNGYLKIFGTDKVIQRYAKRRNAGIIGDGVIAFAPCSPAPLCVLLKAITGMGTIQPDVAALVLPTAGSWPREGQCRRDCRKQGEAFLLLGIDRLQPTRATELHDHCPESDTSSGDECEEPET